jgi:hypothetical protein
LDPPAGMPCLPRQEHLPSYLGAGRNVRRCSTAQKFLHCC